MGEIVKFKDIIDNKINMLKRKNLTALLDNKERAFDLIQILSEEVVNKDCINEPELFSELLKDLKDAITIWFDIERRSSEYYNNRGHS